MDQPCAYCSHEIVDPFSGQMIKKPETIETLIFVFLVVAAAAVVVVAVGVVVVVAVGVVGVVVAVGVVGVVAVVGAVVLPVYVRFQSVFCGCLSFPFSLLICCLLLVLYSCCWLPHPPTYSNPNWVAKMVMFSSGAQS